MELICGDFLVHAFDRRFDVIYSSLTLMHFEDKGQFLRKAASLLRPGGTLVLSLDKNQSEILDMGTRQLRIYPDTPERLIPHLGKLCLERTIETTFSHILICKNSL
jgi:SAM-dependent methyltransferase